VTVAALHPPGDFVSDEIRRTGRPYEADIIAELVERLEGRPLGAIVDVGAHIGNHTIELATRARHTSVHAFEPWSPSFRLLELNTRGWPTVWIHPTALSDKAEKLRMIGDDNVGHSRVDDSGNVEVQALRLDDYELGPVSLIKIDVEGHEAHVLAGAVATIARDRPLICLEDWTLEAPYPDGYRLSVAWPNKQTYLLEPV
jgi:FkbM family methyltransferase